MVRIHVSRGDCLWQALEENTKMCLNGEENAADESAILNQLTRVKNAQAREERALKRKFTQMGLYLTSGFDDSLFTLTERGEEAKDEANAAACAEAEARSAAAGESASAKAKTPLWEYEGSGYRAMDRAMKKEWDAKMPDVPEEYHEPIKLIKLNAAFAALGEPDTSDED